MFCQGGETVGGRIRSGEGGVPRGQYVEDALDLTHGSCLGHYPHSEAAQGMVVAVGPQIVVLQYKSCETALETPHSAMLKRSRKSAGRTSLSVEASVGCSSRRHGRLPAPAVVAHSPLRRPCISTVYGTSPAITGIDLGSTLGYKLRSKGFGSDCTSRRRGDVLLPDYPTFNAE